MMVTPHSVPHKLEGSSVDICESIVPLIRVVEDGWNTVQGYVCTQ